MDWPDVVVIIVTYDRPKEIRRTIKALKENLRYSGKLLWHIADDSSPENYIMLLKQDFKELKLSVTDAERGGWGKNVNKAMIYSHSLSDILFLCEDDYVAKKKLNLNHGVAILMATKKIGLIRYDGIAGHALDLQLREVRTQTGKVNCLGIMESSPHLNLYSNRPHLKHRRFHDCYGLYPEGLKLGATESAFAHTVKNRYRECPKIAVLQDGIVTAFDHIGKSRQRTDLDV